jgi:hypothetical protein
MTKILYVRSAGRWVETGGAGGDPSVQLHDGTQPQPADPTPNGVEAAFRDYEDGLHYFKGSGTLVSILRQPFQTTVVVDGPVRSVARVVSSSGGLPTPQNPSTLVTCDADGKWFKMTSESVNAPFGPPQVLDLFELPLNIAQYVTDAIAAIPPLDPDAVVAAIEGRTISPTTILVDSPIVFGGGYALGVSTTANGPRPTITYNSGTAFVVCAAADDVYTKIEADRKFLDQQYFLDNAYYGPSIVFKDTNGSIRWRTPNLGDGKGPDAVLSTALWTDSPSSAPIPRLYFESDGTAGGYLAYREELDAYLKTGGAAEDIKGQGIEPLLVRVGSGGVVYQDSYKLYVDNVGIGPRAVIEYSNLGVVTRIICMAQGDAYTKAEVDARLSAIAAPNLALYAKLTDTNQTIRAKQVVIDILTLPGCGLVYRDLNDGYGFRLYAAGSASGVEFDPIVLKSDLDGILPRIDALENKTSPASEKSVLYWADPSTAATPLATDSTKNKWLTIGQTTPISFVSGSVYRIDCRIKLGGPLNTDVLQQWLGVRAMGESGSPLPISGVPLVTISGMGNTSVTGERTEIKSTGLPDGQTSLYRFITVDDWPSVGDVLTYTIEFLASETLTASVEFGFAWGGTWKVNLQNVRPMVAVVRKFAG